MVRFLDFLFPPRVDERALRDVSADDFLALMSPRVVPATRPEATALLPFSEPRVRAAVHEAKYRGSGRAFQLLALALAEYLADLDMGVAKSYTVIPVPLGAKRQKERGFNQIEEIARRAGAELGIAIETTLLTRTRETASQISLPRRARQENMRGAFAALQSADRTRIYILVDDVITTGATLQAAADALQEAGAVHIIPLALAH